MFLIQKGEIEGRLNPDFYIKTGYELNSFIYLKNFLFDVFQGETQGEDLVKKVKVLKVKNFNEFGDINFDNITYSDFQNERKILKQHDIITPFRGMAINNRKFALFSSDELATIDNNIGVIRLNDSINAKFVLYFLQTEIGFRQIQKLAVGSSIPAITKEIVKNIKIPSNYFEIQNIIVARFESAYKLKKQKEQQAAELLASIDGYLLNELGIELPKTIEKKKTFFVHSKQLSGGRFDPFYYSSEFGEFEKALLKGKYELRSMNKVANFQAGYAFNSADYVENSDCYLITIRNISKNEVNLNNPTFLPNNFFEKFTAFQIKHNDLLIAMTGATIGKVGIFNLEQKTLLNQRNGLIRSNYVNHLYLMSLLNTDIYQKLILRNSNGGAQPNISETDIMKIKIPLPPLEKQNEIAEHIKAIREQAKQLQQSALIELETAKQQIEQLILGE